MSSRINVFGLPELLLLPVMAVAFYFGHFLMGVMLTVSWVLHVRRRRDLRYPSFGSWFHVSISIFCSLIWVYVGTLSKLVGEGLQLFFWASEVMRVQKRGVRKVIK